MATAGAAAMGESNDSSYDNVDAQQPDNVEAAPGTLEGYAWSKRGYFVFPPDARTL